ncbi:MAG: YggS family pyridoxal phosphate-dependent enzyme [Acidimicrobiales bacterium]
MTPDVAAGPGTGPGRIDPAVVAARADAVRQRIADAGGDPERVRLLAVTKGFGPEVAAAALAAGLADLGESYAQELVAKAPVLAGGPVAPRWHLIGRLQRNKVRTLATLVHRWDSVDRLELGREIARRAPGATVLVQLNLTGEAQKGGCEPAAVDGLVAQLQAEGLVVEGLMGVGRAGDADATRAGFEVLVDAADRLGLPERSIGMSGDLEVAVQAGSTMVRIGRDLFGERPPR